MKGRQVTEHSAWDLSSLTLKLLVIRMFASHQTPSCWSLTLLLMVFAMRSFFLFCLKFLIIHFIFYVCGWVCAFMWGHFLHCSSEGLFFVSALLPRLAGRSSHPFTHWAIHLLSPTGRIFQQGLGSEGRALQQGSLTDTCHFAMWGQGQGSLCDYEAGPHHVCSAYCHLGRDLPSL